MILQTLRGQILDFLRRVGMRDVEEITIIEVFYRLYTVTEIKESLIYLTDKAYIMRTEMEHPLNRRQKKVFYRITAKGIDLLDGVIKDAGVISPGDCDVS